MRLRKLLALCGVVFCFLVISVTPSVAGPCTQDSEAPGIFVPDRGCAEIGVGYQYQQNDIFSPFNTNGYNINFGMHLFDPVTGGNGRLTMGIEGSTTFGFGGRINATPSVQVKTLFVGAGPHLAIQNKSRFEPWIHGLLGVEHLRATQTATLGSNSDLGYVLGGGVDFRLSRNLYWRFQADYLGTHFQHLIQSNRSFGSGLIFYF
jgi:opacity protein-like surface antigen